MTLLWITAASTRPDHGADGAGLPPDGGALQAWLPWVQVSLEPRAGQRALVAQLKDAVTNSPCPPWLVAEGPCAAVAHHVTTQALGLRVAGGIFLEPQPWAGAGAQIALGEDPLPYPALVFSETQTRAPTGWQATLVRAGDLPTAMDHPAVHSMVLQRTAVLRHTGALRDL